MGVAFTYSLIEADRKCYGTGSKSIEQDSAIPEVDYSYQIVMTQFVCADARTARLCYLPHERPDHPSSSKPSSTCRDPRANNESMFVCFIWF